MTRAQQSTSKVLQYAEENWLESYGWLRVSGGWEHPKCKRLARPYGLRDAVALTRADPTLGWP